MFDSAFGSKWQDFRGAFDSGAVVSFHNDGAVSPPTPLLNIRTAVTHLRARGVEDLATLTLMSDGASVYECTSEDEVIDLVRGGQGVFGIAVGKVWREVEGTLSALPAERGSGVATASDDELSERRCKRQIG